MPVRAAHSDVWAVDASTICSRMEPNVALGSQSTVNDLAGQAMRTRAADSDEGGFEEFYRREYLQALRLAWLLTGSRAVAEDVVHDAMAAVYGRFAGVEVPGAYLRRAVVNSARSWQRDERRRRERITLLAERQPVLAAGDDELIAAVDGLPYRQRVVIVARYWGGWSETEIAEMLGCRPGTVKSLASRALNQLRKDIQG
jgi:RNA polymerase sigma factor (sigma-70 family)